MIPIVGWQKTSLIDYPKKISTVLFTPGCNFRCPYCHNPGLVLGTPELTPAPADIIFDHLEKRRKVLDGIVITGGEPTLHGTALIEFIERVKEMGYLVKLDSNGSNPALLKKLIEANLVDYLAMDVKTSLSEYKNLTESNIDPATLKMSIELLKETAQNKQIEVEFRTTLHPLLHSEAVFTEMLQLLQGAPLYVLQTFRQDITLVEEYQQTHPFTEAQMSVLQKQAQLSVNCCLIR